MGRKKETQKGVNVIPLQLRIMLEDFLAVIGLPRRLDQKRNGKRTYTDKPDGSWDQTAQKMMAHVSGSGTFRASSAFERGELRSKGGGKKSIHINGGEENIELILRTVISANQLSVYGALADLCNELSKDSWASVKPDSLDHLEKMEIPTDLSIAENPTNAQQRRNLVQEHERKFEHLSKDQKLSKLCSDVGLKLVERGILLNS